MNKSGLVDDIASGAGLTKALSGKVLDTLISTIINALQAGEDVVIPGFGTFSISNRSARPGRNPQTGETIQIKASKVVKFKAGKNMKEAVQEV